MKLELRISDVGITLETGQQIWEAARDLLRTEGVQVTHPRLMKDVAGRPGLTVAGDRVRIAPDLFEARYPSPRRKHAQRKTNSGGPATAGATLPASPPAAAAPPAVKIGCGGYSMDVIDWRTGALRPATVADLAESCRVVEAAGSRGPYCVTPQDVAPLLQDVATFKTCFEHSRRNVRGAYYSSPRQAPFIEEMCGVMGEPFRLLLGVVSPLKLSNSDLDTIYTSVAAAKRHPIQLVGYGVPGIGSPAGLAASAALVMAENYGAALLVALAFPENDVSAGVSAGGPTDFRHCNYAHGAPHTFAYQVINAHLDAALSGIDPARGVGAFDVSLVDPTDTVGITMVSLMTGACEPDEQAAAEKAGIATIGALLGARRFGSAGNLCVDDVFSLEQFMIDRELAEHAVKTVECCGPSAVMAQMGAFAEEMRSVMAGEDFLGLPSTMAVMRAFYRPGRMFEHMKLRAWQGGGCRAIRAKAREEIEHRLAASDFALDAEKKRALGRIYHAAEQALS